MAKSVLRELDQLRSMLDKPSASSSLRESYSSEYSSRPEGMKTYSYALNTAEKSVDRLGRAIEAAEEEMEAALRRTTDIHKTQLKQKDMEIHELQRVVVAKERALDGLREQLASTKRSYEARLQEVESALNHKDTEISTLHAEVLALRAEREDLELRVQKGASSLTRLELELKDRTADMSSSIKAKADEAAHATAAYHRERKEKELLQIEVSELKRELDGLEDELRAAKREAQHTHDRLQSESALRREAEQQLDKQTAKHNLVKEAKDLEIQELRQRLQSERGVRKACEKWLKAELKSRDDIESLHVVMRDIALGKATTETEMTQVESLLDKMKDTKSSPTAKGNLSSAERYRKEFADMKKALESDSQHLKTELAAARRLLKEKLASS
eukprot:jgi/Chrzof1/14008/Cz08g20290.t1